MNTGTGQIYSPEELAERRAAAEARLELDERQAEFVRADAEGKIMPAATLTGPQASRLFAELSVRSCEPTDSGALWRFDGGLVLTFNADGPLPLAWHLAVEGAESAKEA